MTNTDIIDFLPIMEGDCCGETHNLKSILFLPAHLSSSCTSITYCAQVEQLVSGVKHSRDDERDSTVINIDRCVTDVILNIHENITTIIKLMLLNFDEIIIIFIPFFQFKKNTNVYGPPLVEENR